MWIPMEAFMDSNFLITLFCILNSIGLLVILYHVYKSRDANYDNFRRLYAHMDQWFTTTTNIQNESRKETQVVTKEFKEHLDQVKNVIAAAMPYMDNKDLTPENVVAAFKELEADNELTLKQAQDELDGLISGTDL